MCEDWRGNLSNSKKNNLFSCSSSSLYFLPQTLEATWWECFSLHLYYIFIPADISFSLISRSTLRFTLWCICFVCVEAWISTISNLLENVEIISLTVTGSEESESQKPYTLLAVSLCIYSSDSQQGDHVVHQQSKQSFIFMSVPRKNGG